MWQLKLQIPQVQKCYLFRLKDKKKAAGKTAFFIEIQTKLTNDTNFSNLVFTASLNIHKIDSVVQAKGIDFSHGAIH